MQRATPAFVTRSRVVSSVSAEQVEAPKNYVDYEQEPDKLKGFLKGKPIKENRNSFSGVLSSGPTSDAGNEPEPEPEPDRPSPATSVSRVRVSSLTPPSRSSASSPSPLSPVTASNSQIGESTGSTSLLLTCHVLPPRRGSAHPVAALKSYDQGRPLICLQETGDISVFATADGTCLASTTVPAQPTSLARSPRSATAYAPTLWTWRGLHVDVLGEMNILIVCATSDAQDVGGGADSADLDSEGRVRLVAYEVRDDGIELGLSLLGDWEAVGCADSVAICRETDGTLTLLYTSAHRLVARTLTLSAPRPSPSPDSDGEKDAESSTPLPIPNPFKALQALSRERVAETETETDDAAAHAWFGEANDLGDVPVRGRIYGARAIDGGGGVRVAVWSDVDLSVLEYHDHCARVLFTEPLSDTRDVEWLHTESFTVLHPDRADMYSIIEVTADNDAVDTPSSLSPRLLRPTITRSVPLPHADCQYLAPGGTHVYSTDIKDGRHRLRVTALDSERARTLWKSRTSALAFESESGARITAALPIDIDEIILGCSDGRLRRTSLVDWARGSVDGSEAGMSDVALGGYVVALHRVVDERTKELYIVGGADDGSVAIWSCRSLALLVRWTVFTAPLAYVIHVNGEDVGRLRGCVLCISQDGTIAVITIDGHQFICLIPAAAAPLQKVNVSGDSLLLLYADGRARLWDTKTMEFWRSMTAAKADEMLSQGAWVGWGIESMASPSSSVLSSIPGECGANTASTLQLDVEAFIKQYSSNPPATESAKSDTVLKHKLEQLRCVLGGLLTFGLSSEIDRICHEKLAIGALPVSAHYFGSRAISLYGERSTQGLWSVSPDVSALRALALLSLLQALAHHEEFAADATTVMTFYAASLTEVTGPLYRSPSLPFLARAWLRTAVPEVRHASRLFFDAGVARLTDEETAQLVQHWHQYLPSNVPESQRQLVRGATSIAICGSVAIEKYTLLSTGVLTDIAKSVALYLHNEYSPHRALAIDLCSRGFQVWQQYVDAVEMLRALFTLATTSRKEAVSPHNIGAQARTAVLHIASTNTPLFMTTLTIDILQPRSVQHRKSVMQLVIFLIRKKPLVLYSNLPRLVEAVVKSLDPNSTANRDAVLDSATDILGHVVQTFPTVDFHMPTQRLAVGTSEGAVVMYDLKTATRLYVLEGHKKRTTACSFSPDGRRLVTLSLEESVVLVWKVGSSFSSFFMPGAPPRQGHSGSDPFKTLGFNVGDEGRMTLAATLGNVRFEWPADRSVRLKIRESTLTFST
ncbi:WD40 repeat-like protein [Wolfiporia cocos MD-104 SS10]|uniref:WD40 repeat-like protein n=1 Tax=Wolfiporia cocos (strain MD-104) TaxID=742152 RepID=A0A2H3JDQ9_WOLCO|nr:WD40 repeat-like protein [Wolfiporia cocos MD-104 SS10]